MDDITRSARSEAPSKRKGFDLPPWWALIGVLGIVVLTWNIPAISPDGPGGDYDYHILIALVHPLGLSFADISTTYGPLYFLAVPAILWPTGVWIGYLSWAIWSAAVLTALWQAVRAARSSATAWAAVAITSFSMCVVPLSSFITAGFVLLSVLAIGYATGRLPRWAERAFPVLAAVSIAAMLLTKFSVGLTAGPIVLAALIARDGSRIRRLLAAAVGGVLALIAFWCATGEQASTLPTFVVNQLSVGSGHADSMGTEVPGQGWEYPVAIIATVLLLVAVLRAGPRMWIVAAGLGLTSFLAFKQGFVRHDGHSAQYFAFLAIVLLGVELLIARRRPVLGALMAPTAAAALIAQIAVMQPDNLLLVPVNSVRSFAQGATWANDSTARTGRLDEAQSNIRARLGLPEDFANRIGDESVRTEPFDFGMAYAYGLRQTIVPTLLDYGAYTTRLDELDEAWIDNSKTAPRFIVRENTRITLDGRNALWDPPRTLLAESCRYRPAQGVDQSGRWQLLERTSARCSAPRTLARVEARAGEPVSVPSSTPGTIVVMSVDADRSTASKLRSFLFKPADMYVAVDSDRFRLPLTHATGAPLLIRAPDTVIPELSGVPLQAQTVTTNYAATYTFEEISLTD